MVLSKLQKITTGYISRQWYLYWQSELQWRHHGRDGVSNHQSRDRLLSHLIRLRSKKISVSLAFVRGIHRWPVNSPHKWPVTRNMFLFDDVTMRENVREKSGNGFLPTPWQTYGNTSMECVFGMEFLYIVILVSHKVIYSMIESTNKYILFIQWNVKGTYRSRIRYCHTTALVKFVDFS